MIIYNRIIKKLVQESFLAVQHHDYDSVLNGVAAENLTHRFAGSNSLGGIRHDKEALERWFKRVGTVLPNLQFEITNILVHGGPWNTTVVARWIATCKLANGDHYINPGVHIIKIRWGKAYDFDVYEDTFAVTCGLDIQARSGIDDAKAPQIQS